MRLRIAFVVVLAFVAVLVVGTPAQAHYEAHEACKGSQEAGDWSSFSFCMGNVLDAPGGGAKTQAVVGCESGFNRWATSSSGTFRGLTQQHVDYYQSRVRTYAKLHINQASNIYSGRWNVVVGIRMAKAAGTWAGAWPYCGR